MLFQLFILFIIGIVLCVVAYFIRTQRVLKIILNCVGGLLIALPLLLLIYFLVIIFTS